MDKKEIKYIAFGSNYEPYLETAKVLPIEQEIKGKNFIGWGIDNAYPQYLYDLFSNVATLRTLINAVCDYVCGDGVISSNEAFISNETLESIVYDIALSYAIYGGFAIQVLRNKFGMICKLEVMDMRYVRSDKKNKYIYYSEDFGKRTYGRCNAICYPAYDSSLKQDVSVYFYKNEKFNTYPQPVHIAAITACELERGVNDYHLNSLNNSFSGSFLVNMNNGVPEDEQKQEIVDAFEEKFTGAANAGRVVVTFNDSKDNATELIQLKTEDFGEKYKSLIERATSQIFTSWRCSQQLVGMAQDNVGFNNQEWDSSFKLFQKTVIFPIQKLIVTTINKLFENQLEVEIKPFSINFDEKNVDDDDVKE